MSVRKKIDVDDTHVGDEIDMTVASNCHEEFWKDTRKNSNAEINESTPDQVEPIEHPKAQASLTAAIIVLAIPFLSTLISYSFPSTSLFEVLGPLATLLGLGLIVLAILAIVWGGIALRAIKESPDQYTGEGKARVGKALGWVYIGLAILSAIVLRAPLKTSQARHFGFSNPEFTLCK